MNWTKTIIVSIGSLALVACNKSSAPPASTDGTYTPASGPRSATESIAQSRCQREQRCENVGAERKYSSEADCLARIRNDWRDDLSARECKSGINQTQLNECLAKIRMEECSSPFDTLARVSECTAAQICKD